MVSYISLITFLSTCISQTSGIFFYMHETERKCFMEEIPKDTTLKAKYRIQLFDSATLGYLPATPGIGIHVEVLDPRDKVMLSKFYASEGHFFFTSYAPGNHHICLSTNSTKWKLFRGGRMRVYLDIASGEPTVEDLQISAKNELLDFHTRTKHLVLIVEQISKEQAFQRVREEIFRRMSESTNQRVLWLASFQTIVLLFTGLWQMKHMRGFFEAKKLV